MTLRPGELSGDELVDIADESGFGITKTQLSGWHRAGLFPKPRRPGRGRGVGRPSLYPAGSDRQLLALCRAKAEHRYYAEIAWRLWWQGYRVRFAYIRTRLSRVAASIDKNASEARAYLEEEAKLDQLLREAPEAVLSGTLARARRRVGKQNFDTFIFFMLQIASGNFAGFQNGLAAEAVKGELTPEQIFEKAFAADRARTDTLADAEPWLVEGMTPTLIMLSSLISAQRLAEVARRSTVKQIEAERELAGSLAGLAPAQEMLESLHGKNAFGAPLFGELGQADPDWQAAVICFLLLARRMGEIEAIPSEFDESRQALAEMSEQLALFEELAQEIPAFAPFLDMMRFGKAQRTLGGLEKLQAELRAVHAHHAEEVARFMEGRAAKEPD